MIERDELLNTLFSHPKSQKAIRYIAAYSLFFLFTFLGLVITEISRGNLLDLCTLLKVNPDTIHILYTWGGYVLYVPYVLSIAFLEEYMNAAAKKGLIVTRAGNVAIVEGSIGLVTILLYLLFFYMGFPRPI